MLGHCCPSVAIDCLSIQPAPRHRTEQHSLSARAARAPLPNRKYTALKNGGALYASKKIPGTEPGNLLRDEK
jgi:hypothetical protein